MRFWKKPIPVIGGPDLKEILAPAVPIFDQQASSGAQGDAMAYLRNLLEEEGLLAESQRD